MVGDLVGRIETDGHRALNRIRFIQLDAARQLPLDAQRLVVPPKRHFNVFVHRVPSTSRSPRATLSVLCLPI